MFTRASVGSVFVFTAFGLIEGRADAPRDQDESRLVRSEGGFEGGWKVSSAVLGSIEISEDKFEDFTVVFESCELTVLSKGTEVLKGQITADPSTKPAEIDFTPDGGPHKGMTFKGIYEVDVDTLAICMDSNGKGIRPTEFTAKAGSARLLLVLKRLTP
jgi:uncharacterized protein (TIGR03067 family)